MDRKNLINFVSACGIILIGIIVLLLPLFNILNVQLIFILIITLYGIFNLIKNLILINIKEFSGFSKAIACVVVLCALLFLEINDNPWNLALILFIWIILISLAKLKEADYYHDRKNKLWLINITNLILFIICGILTTLNLYCTNDVQILILGYFFLTNGILDLMLPLVNHLLGKK